jgi:hypothetical protein
MKLEKRTVFGGLLLVVGVLLIGTVFVTPINNTAQQQQFSPDDFIFGQPESLVPNIPIELPVNQISVDTGDIVVIDFDEIVDFTEITDLNEVKLIKIDGEIICVSTIGTRVANCPLDMFTEIISPKFIAVTSDNSTITQLLEENALGDVLNNFSFEEKETIKTIPQDDKLLIFMPVTIHYNHSALQ